MHDDYIEYCKAIREARRIRFRVDKERANSLIQNIENTANSEDFMHEFIGIKAKEQRLRVINAAREKGIENKIPKKFLEDDEEDDGWLEPTEEFKQRYYEELNSKH